MLLFSIATLTPRHRTRRSSRRRAPGCALALTATWPPVARVIEPFWNSTLPPL
jgi:hypothetical protein